LTNKFLNTKLFSKKTGLTSEQKQRRHNSSLAIWQV